MISTISIEYLYKTLKGAKYNNLPIFGNKSDWKDLIKVVEKTAQTVKWAEEVSELPREWMYYLPTLEKQYTTVKEAFANVGIIIPDYTSEATLWCNIKKIASFDGKIKAIKKIA